MLSGKTLAQFVKITVEPSKYLIGWHFVVGYKEDHGQMILGTYRTEAYAKTFRTQLIERRRSYLRSQERGLF